jgi:hypothetical protein
MIQVREKGDDRNWEDIPSSLCTTKYPDQSARRVGREYEKNSREVVQVRWQLYAAPDEGKYSGHFIDFPEEPEYQIEGTVREAEICLVALERLRDTLENKTDEDFGGRYGEVEGFMEEIDCLMGTLEFIKGQG